MNIQLSDTLRPLRQQAGLTQSALAERLGVSDRAVSRWENGSALPDVTLLPPLAMLLGVSVDALLGVDSQRRQSAIDAALSACSHAMQQGDAPTAVALLRETLVAWPDEPELIVALARALTALHTDDAAREALSLCRAADGKPARLSTQYGCKQVMALALHRLGRSEEAARLVSDELPSFWVSREMLYPRVAPAEKAEGQRQFNLLWLADHLYFTLREMAKAQPDQAIPLLERAVRIFREATGGADGHSACMYEERIAQAQVMLARRYAQAGDISATMSALTAAVSAADALAAHDGRYGAPWLPAAHDAPASTRTITILRDHIRCAMGEAVFDSLRSVPAFASLLRRLSTEPRMKEFHPCAAKDIHK